MTTQRRLRDMLFRHGKVFRFRFCMAFFTLEDGIDILEHAGMVQLALLHKHDTTRNSLFRFNHSSLCNF